MQIDWTLKLRLHLRHQVRRLSADTRGIAAVEFAMLIPLMLMVFFGTIQISTAVAVDRKVSLTARTLSDLISQAPGTIKDTDISNAFATALAILSPYTPTPLQAKISQVYIDKTTLVAKVKWSKASGTGVSPHTCNEVVTVPTALQIADTYLIMSEVTYNFQPVVGYDIHVSFVSATYPLSDLMYTRPRQSTSISYPTEPACT
jgi:Flp pilus assembly protein TadG